MSVHAITETVPSVNNFEGCEENLAGIPEEIWRIIFAQTSLKTQVALSRTAKLFYVITKPIMRETIIAQHAFGKAQWERFFGDVGVEPPLPEGIGAILNGPCPFWSGKKVHETHLLTLVPKTVQGQPLTLDHLGELIQNPKQGAATRFCTPYYGTLKRYHGSTPVKEAHWALMTRDVIPGSKDESYEDQELLLNRVNRCYSLPTLLDAATSILMGYFATGQMPYKFELLTVTRCQENVHGYPTVTGGFGPSGLYASDTRFLLPPGCLGVAGLRKF